MKFFVLDNGNLTPTDEQHFRYEKEIQVLVEKNLNPLFGLELVSSEFKPEDSQHMVETLAFNPQKSSFVIIEYKCGSNHVVIDQGHNYLAMLRKRKADFVLEYNEKTGKSLTQDQINWEKIKVIFIAPVFNRYQIAVASSPINKEAFELWQIKKYSDNMISMKPHHAADYHLSSPVTAGACRPPRKKHKKN